MLGASETALISQLAQTLGVRSQQVQAAVGLLDDGATVPFIARYRKEATGGLDDTQLRTLETQLTYLRGLEERRGVIMASIQEQGKLTPELNAALMQVTTKADLEALYLPYKPKRRNKAQIARESGLGPLAAAIEQSPDRSPSALAQAYVNPDQGVADVEAALAGAQQILMESWAEQPQVLKTFRGWLWQGGLLTSTVVKGQEDVGAKFSDYFAFQEPIKRVPSHRALAVFRGKAEGVLKYALALGRDKAEQKAATEQAEARLTQLLRLSAPLDPWVKETISQTWKAKVLPHLETEVMAELREQAETEAMAVFSKNLRDLLMASPAGPHVTMGLDPGLRTGVKVALVDGTGQVIETGVIYPHPPQNDWEGALTQLHRWIERYQVSLISIGNGTGSRETDRLVLDLMKRTPALSLQKMVVSEAGASVYSASELAAQELPTLDVSLRGAVSIARRLQDPLAELVKIDPKAIGVGQYQHDVNQPQLGRQLDAVVEDCVNAVGVDVNTASPALLTYVSGLSKSLAQQIVLTRNQQGPFRDRQALKKVPKLGPKAFEQAAGFLRIMNGSQPLDASAVHPEAYPVVERILKSTGRDLPSVLGDKTFLSSLNLNQFTDDRFGLPTVQDIVAELEKPGRDPRPSFQTATFKEGVETLKDLVVGMVLEGVVTNVTNFGAFVDVGVHQDGLVHISQLADRFVKDPHTVVKTGQVVQVKVVEVDQARKRIALTMRLSDKGTP